MKKILRVVIFYFIIFSPYAIPSLPLLPDFETFRACHDGLLNAPCPHNENRSMVQLKALSSILFFLSNYYDMGFLEKNTQKVPRQIVLLDDIASLDRYFFKKEHEDSHTQSIISNCYACIKEIYGICEKEIVLPLKKEEIFTAIVEEKSLQILHLAVLVESIFIVTKDREDFLNVTQTRKKLCYEVIAQQGISKGTTRTRLKKELSYSSDVYFDFFKLLIEKLADRYQKNTFNELYAWCMKAYAAHYVIYFDQID